MIQTLHLIIPKYYCLKMKIYPNLFNKIKQKQKTKMKTKLSKMELLIN